MPRWRARRDWELVRGSSTDAKIYVVGPDQPTVLVQLDDPTASWRAALQAAFTAVPIPPGAQPGSDADAEMTVWQPSSDKLWEFFHMRLLSDGWHAAWGGAIQNVSQSPGYYDASAWPGASTSWGATASSLPHAAGVITLADIEPAPSITRSRSTCPIRARASTHGLRSAPMGPEPQRTASPRARTCESTPASTSRRFIFRRLVQMMAEAAQKYGMIVRDQTHWAIGFWIEDPAPTGTDPFYSNGAPSPTGPFQGMWPNQLMSYFPWSAVQVLKMDLTPT